MTTPDIPPQDLANLAWAMQASPPFTHEDTIREYLAREQIKAAKAAIDPQLVKLLITLLRRTKTA